MCHTDIHTDNILVDKENRIFIIDWDNPLLAPRERDLMFVANTKEKQLFFDGYGDVDVDLTVLSYYKYEWVVQEIGDYGQRVLLNKNFGNKTKKDAVKSFFALFEPDDVVDSAFKADLKFHIFC